MAISAVFGEKVTRIEGEWIDVTFDANLNEVSTQSVQVTSNPVEDGSNIADNAVDDPDEIQIEGLITNTPADIVDAVSAFATRAEDAFEDLQTLIKEKEIVTVSTTVRVLENMFITRLTRNRSPTTGEAVHVNITLREIRKVQSSVAEVPLRATKGAKKSVGTKPTTPASPAQSGSLLDKIGRLVVP